MAQGAFPTSNSHIINQLRSRTHEKRRGGVWFFKTFESHCLSQRIGLLWCGTNGIFGIRLSSMSSGAGRKSRLYSARKFGLDQPRSGQYSSSLKKKSSLEG